jgi:hypothetical protein
VERGYRPDQRSQGAAFGDWLRGSGTPWHGRVGAVGILAGHL